MILFFTIYILGIIASLYLMYHSMEKGEEVTLAEIMFFIVASLFSWISIHDMETTYIDGRFFEDFKNYIKGE